MTKITSILMLLLFALIAFNGYTQDDSVQKRVKILEQQKNAITKQEKRALKEEVKSINERLEKEVITENEAQILKEEVARKRAMNIENRLAILDNKIALLLRNEDMGGEFLDGIDYDSIAQLEEDHLLFIKLNSKRKEKEIRRDKRTYKNLVVGFGLNNALISGTSFSDSPYEYLGSRFFEIGYAWNTRVFKNTNWLRIKYGFSFQFNGLKPTENRFFTLVTGDLGFPVVELRSLPDGQGGVLPLFKSKYRMDSFVIPVHFEMGPSVRREYRQYKRYSTNKMFKIGIGTYFGFNYFNRQKVRGESRNDQIIVGFSDTGNGENQRIIAGLSTYIGFDDLSLYFKYELTPMFEEPSVQQNNISLGLRFDL